LNLGWEKWSSDELVQSLQSRDGGTSGSASGQARDRGDPR